MPKQWVWKSCTHYFKKQKNKNCLIELHIEFIHILFGSTHQIGKIELIWCQHRIAHNFSVKNSSWQFDCSAYFVREIFISLLVTSTDIDFKNYCCWLSLAVVYMYIVVAVIVVAVVVVVVVVIHTEFFCCLLYVFCLHTTWTQNKF